jgi:hypothetical protein
VKSNFSKLKLIKYYLRLTIYQQRALLKIEKETLNKINHNKLINDFASQKIDKIIIFYKKVLKGLILEFALGIING